MSIESESREDIKMSRRVIKTVRDWLAYKDKAEWLKDMRGNLSMVASIIATISFQSAVNPPGGVFQANPNDDLNRYYNNSTNVIISIKRGQAVLAAVSPNEYLVFLVFNTICFISSLSVCLLLVSGFPLDYRFPTWILSILMCITITSLAITYLFAVFMVTPDLVWNGAESIFNVVLYIWIGLMGIVGFVIFTRLFFWSYRKWNESRKNSQ